MNRHQTLQQGAYVVLTVLLLAGTAAANVPDYNLQLTERERDSLATAEYPYIFPLFGKDVIRKGFDLPFPVGINLGYHQQGMGALIDEVSIGFVPEALMPLTFIEFGDITNDAANYNGRVDLWLFPFLNLYGIFGYAEADADVTLSAPFEFSTSVDFTGWTYGGGAVLAFGVQGFWLTVNGGLAWTDMEDYHDPLRATVLSARLGHTLPIMKTDNIQIYLGAMYQDPESRVAGRFLLADIITDELAAQFQDYYLSAWYNALTDEEKQFIDAFVQTMAQGSADTGLEYVAVQHPETSWNMLGGVQLELSKSWYVQVEAGFLNDRSSLTMNLSYRFPL